MCNRLRVFFSVLTCITLGPILIYFVYKFTQFWRRSRTDATGKEAFLETDVFSHQPAGLYKVLHILKESTACRENEWHPALVKYQLAGMKRVDDDVFN